MKKTELTLKHIQEYVEQLIPENELAPVLLGRLWHYPLSTAN